jgi:hypothetical protein
MFRTCSDRFWGSNSLLFNWYRIFPEGKTAGEWRLPPTLSISKVKERVELYLYSSVKHKGESTPLQAWTVPEGFRKLRLPNFMTVGT